MLESTAIVDVKCLRRTSDEFVKSAKPGNMFELRACSADWVHECVPVTSQSPEFGNVRIDCSLPLLYLGVVKMGVHKRRYLNFLASTQNGLQKVVWLEDISLRWLVKYKQ